MPTNNKSSLQSMHSYTCHSDIGQDPLESSWKLHLGTSKDEIECSLRYYQMYDPRACLASLGSTNLSGLQICGWCRQ